MPTDERPYPLLACHSDPFLPKSAQFCKFCLNSLPLTFTLPFPLTLSLTPIARFLTRGPGGTDSS